MVFLILHGWKLKGFHHRGEEIRSIAKLCRYSENSMPWHLSIGLDCQCITVCSKYSVHLSLVARSEKMEEFSISTRSHTLISGVLSQMEIKLDAIASEYQQVEKVPIARIENRIVCEDLQIYVTKGGFPHFVPEPHSKVGSSSTEILGHDIRLPTQFSSWGARKRDKRGFFRERGNKFSTQSLKLGSVIN